MVFGVETIISKGSRLSLTQKQDEVATSSRSTSRITASLLSFYKAVLLPFHLCLVKTYVPFLCTPYQAVFWSICVVEVDRCHTLLSLFRYVSRHVCVTHLSHFPFLPIVVQITTKV